MFSTQIKLIFYRTLGNSWPEIGLKFLRPLVFSQLLRQLVSFPTYFTVSVSGLRPMTPPRQCGQRAEVKKVEGPFIINPYSPPPGPTQTPPGQGIDGWPIMKALLVCDVEGTTKESVRLSGTRWRTSRSSWRMGLSWEMKASHNKPPSTVAQPPAALLLNSLMNSWTHVSSFSVRM